jgi:succinate dehydrogenase/fumarate reductase-like Fe-S protein
MPSLHALVYLGWRAVFVEPVKRLFQRGAGIDRFLSAFAADRLAPTSLADREVSVLASRCIGCGLCEPGCRLAGASPAVRALGLPAAFRLVGRAGGDLAGARDLLAACQGCAGCRALCPTGVPIGRVLARLAERAEAAR